MVTYRCEIPIGTDEKSRATLFVVSQNGLGQTDEKIGVDEHCDCQVSQAHRSQGSDRYLLG